MRNAFAAELGALAAADPRVVMLSGDIGNRLFDAFKERFPTRFYNCGVAEANMMGMAAGLAMSGLRPIAYTIAPFVTSRCFEQIKIDVAYHRAPVTIVGVGAGLSYASLGPTHHSFEDIAILRTLPNLAIVCPGDALEVGVALRAAVAHDGPVYLRLGIKGEPVVHGAPPAFAIGRAIEVRAGGDVALLSTGNVLPAVRDAADILASGGISARVLSVHTVKPIDREALERAFSGHRLVVTVEEHGLIGGFGASVAEWLADGSGRGVPLLRIGIPDEFLHSAGNQRFARERFGLTAPQIAAAVTARLRTTEEQAHA